MTRSKYGRGLLSLGALIAMCATATVAFAADSGLLTVNGVDYSNNTLVVQLSNGTDYVGSAAAPYGCTSASANTLKVWAAEAQSALLSGKRLKINFSICGSVPYIATLGIWN